MVLPCSGPIVRKLWNSFQSLEFPTLVAVTSFQGGYWFPVTVSMNNAWIISPAPSSVHEHRFWSSHLVLQCGLVIYFDKRTISPSFIREGVSAWPGEINAYFDWKKTEGRGYRCRGRRNSISKHMLPREIQWKCSFSCWRESACVIYLESIQWGRGVCQQL